MGTIADEHPNAPAFYSDMPRSHGSTSTYALRRLGRLNSTDAEPIDTSQRMLRAAKNRHVLTEVALPGDMHTRAAGERPNVDDAAISHPASMA
jgi:hypothetical protein